jgi:hypothetical protein
MFVGKSEEISWENKAYGTVILKWTLKKHGVIVWTDSN